MDEPLSDEYSIWGYRLFLDREPESEQTIKNRTGVFKRTRLQRQHFLSSEEYNLKNQDWNRFYYLGLLPKMEVSTELNDAQQAKLTKHVQKTWEDLGEADAHWPVLSTDSYRSDKIEENQEDFKQSARTDMMILEATLERNGIDLSGFQSCREFGCGVGRVTRHLAERFARVEGIDISRKHSDIASQSIPANGLTHVTFKHITSPDELGKLPQSEVFKIIDQSNCLTVEVIEDEYIGRNPNMLSNTFVIQKKR